MFQVYIRHRHSTHSIAEVYLGPFYVCLVFLVLLGLFGFCDTAPVFQLGFTGWKTTELFLYSTKPFFPTVVQSVQAQYLAH